MLPRVKRSWAGFAGLVTAVAVASLHLTSTAGCIEEDTTQFGNPNTLSRANLPGEAGVTPVITGCAAHFDGGCPSFDTDIYPYLTAAGAWKCADATCHGSVSKPEIKGDSPDTLFASLAVIQLDGKPYLPGNGVEPANARMLCSLQGICGDKMPKPPGIDPTPEELCIIDAWLKCGTPR